MTDKDFKKGLKAELKYAWLTDNKLNTIVFGVETVIFFMQDVLPESPLGKWLQDRFLHGVTIAKNGVRINTPNQNNKIPKHPKHSQGKWELKGWFIQKENRDVIAQVYGSGMSSITLEEAQANAQRIVMMANNHDELVEVLKDRIEHLEEYIQNYSGKGKPTPQIARLENAKELLKKVEPK